MTSNPKNRLYEAISFKKEYDIKDSTRLIYVLDVSDDTTPAEFRETKRIFDALFASNMRHLLINQNTYLIGIYNALGARDIKSAEVRSKLKVDVDRSPESLDKLVKILEVAKILIPNFL